MSFRRLHLPVGSQIKVVLWFALTITIVEIFNLYFDRSLNDYGLIPREIPGLIGVATAPFLHGNFMHYFSNIIPLVVFSFLLLQHGAKRFWLITFVVSLISGLLVWGLGRAAIHVGASGLIYGYFGYLLVAGLLSKEVKLLLISLFVGVGYGGMIWGILPSMPFVSWEFHFFGFMVGVLLAFSWGRAYK